jgi:DNA-binding MurR/RpiR family transcriptional regulator
MGRCQEMNREGEETLNETAGMLEQVLEEDDWLAVDTPLILLNIQAKLPSLNPAQKRVAYYILRNFQQLEGMTSKELAGNCEVSEPTVTRFVKEMGYENYRKFQLDVAKFHPGKRKSGYSSVSSEDTVEVVCRKVIDDNLRSVAALSKTIDYAKLETAKKLLVQADTILLLAQGRSWVTANSLSIRLFRLGLKCLVYNDPHAMAVSTSLVQANDLAIGISTFGRTKDVVEGMRRARQRGCRTIGVTSYKDVPLEEVSDIVLLAVDTENASFGFEPSGATVAQMVLLDCLYMLVALETKERSERAFQDTYEALQKIKL